MEDRQVRSLIYAALFGLAWFSPAVAAVGVFLAVMDCLENRSTKISEEDRCERV